MFKKILCSLLVVVICLTMVPWQGLTEIDLNWRTINAQASTLAESGQCGDASYWTFDRNTGKLIISGSGALYKAVFAHEADIKIVIIEEGITEISYDCFYYCYNLKTVSLPSSLSKIGGYAFGKTAIESILIPKNVTTIEPGFVLHCNLLKSIGVHPQNNNFEVKICDPGVMILFSEDLTELVQYPIGNDADSIIIPNSVTHIRDLAFNDSVFLKNIDLPKKLNYIGSSAFSLCIGIKSIVIPETVKEISNNAFDACYRLDDIYVLSDDAILRSDCMGVLEYKIIEKDKDELYNETTILFKSLTPYEMQSYHDKHLKYVDSYAFGTIHCEKGATVETYAKNNGIEFDNSLNLLDGYCYEEDSYSFLNLDGSVEEEYWQEMYGAAWGYLLYLKNKNDNGHCFGMAYSVASIIDNKPKVNTFSSSQCIDILNKNTYNDDIKMSVKDFIKYSQIYQASFDVNANRLLGLGTKNVYSAVKESNKPLLIEFVKGLSGHAVLAVGVADSSIIIYDSNMNSLKNILIEDNKWSYLGTKYSSDNGYIIRYLDVDSGVYDFINNSNNFNLYNLIIADGNYSVSTGTAEVYSIYNLAEASTTTNNEMSAYWTTSDSIQISNADGEDGFVAVSDNKVIIETNLPDDSMAVFCLSENKVDIETKNSNTFSVKYTSFINDHMLSVAIDAVAQETVITVSQNETGILVSGFSDGTVTLCKDNKVITTQTVCNAISDVEVYYDKTGKDEKLAVDYEQPEIPSEPDVSIEPDAPDIPETPEDPANTCSHICHKSGFLGFIWKVINFFQKLFGISPVCECGAAHY